MPICPILPLPRDAYQKTSMNAYTQIYTPKHIQEINAGMKRIEKWYGTDQQSRNTYSYAYNRGIHACICNKSYIQGCKHQYTKCTWMHTDPEHTQQTLAYIHAYFLAKEEEPMIQQRHAATRKQRLWQSSQLSHWTPGAERRQHAKESW